MVGAVTTAWDKAHAAIASMGDRFVLVRMDSTTGRQKAGRQAIGNTGSEVQMRAELAAAAAGVLTGMDTEPITVTDGETDALLAAADLVTLARTGVEYDYHGDVIDAHAPEMPTRFAKQLAQVVRGGVAIGMNRGEALRLAIRCARDSMPPLRLAIVDDIAAHPDSSTAEVRKRIGKPRATADRQLQALHMLGVVECDEEETTWAGRDVTRWTYRLADGIEPGALNPKSVPDLAVPTPKPQRRGEGDGVGTHTPVAKSGTDSPAETCPECGLPTTPGTPTPKLPMGWPLGSMDWRLSTCRQRTGRTSLISATFFRVPSPPYLRAQLTQQATTTPLPQVTTDVPSCAHLTTRGTTGHTNRHQHKRPRSRLLCPQAPRHAPPGHNSPHPVA